MSSTPDEDEDPAAETGRRMDPELLAMGRLARILDGLASEAARHGVARWLADRYDVNPQE